MELTQKDYNERKARLDAGTGDDEDARLVKLYEREGFGPVADPPPAVNDTSPAATDGDGSGESEPVDPAPSRRRGR